MTSDLDCRKIVKMKSEGRITRAGRAVGERPPNEYGSPVAMKRLTIDVSADLHSAIKVGCARRGMKMADALGNEFGAGE